MQVLCPVNLFPHWDLVGREVTSLQSLRYLHVGPPPGQSLGGFSLEPYPGVFLFEPYLPFSSCSCLFYLISFEGRCRKQNFFKAKDQILTKAVLEVAGMYGKSIVQYFKI